MDTIKHDSSRPENSDPAVSCYCFYHVFAEQYKSSKLNTSASNFVISCRANPAGTLEMLQLMEIQFRPKHIGVCFQEEKEDVADDSIQSPTQNYWTGSNVFANNAGWNPEWW
jgi:hypothetical protein